MTGGGDLKTTGNEICISRADKIALQYFKGTFISSIC